MRALLAIAGLLLACSAAQAQYTIEYGGKTIRIDPDRGTVSIPGVYDNTGKKAKRARTNQDGSQKQAPTQQQQTTVDPAIPAPAPSTQAPAGQPGLPANNVPAAAAATATNAPAETALSPPAPVQPSAAPMAPSSATVATGAAAPSPPAAAPAARPPTPGAAVATVSPAPAPSVRDPNSPVGIWLTEEKEGKVRIEPCGANLCGYSVEATSNANGDQVLINMKPGKDQKWSGRIHDPNTGSNYDSTIALQGKDELRVQGCAFGGMFCGGQTWTRAN